MSTPEVHPPHAAEARFCEFCGAHLGSGRFCPECGHEVHGHDAHAAEAPTEVHVPSVPPAPPVQPPAPTARRGPSPALIAGIVAALVIVAAAVAVVLLTGGDDAQDAKVAYQEKVASIFGPVLGANREIADELDALRGTKPTDAKLAVRRGQQATTMAQGALGALTVPEDTEALAADARQVLERERAYLAAVSTVLNTPSSPARDRVETLAADLSSALSAAGPTVAGTDASITGADRLAAWAPRAARTLRERAAAKEEQITETQGAERQAPANPYADGRACGDGVYAGPNTSCDFAFNVRDAYYAAPGLVATVQAYSPATGRIYTMDCAPSGSAITCSGANNASVTF